MPAGKIFVRAGFFIEYGAVSTASFIRIYNGKRGVFYDQNNS
jgi:hypothetical protein